MDDSRVSSAVEALHAVEAVRLAKARYFRGVDTNDGSLVRAVLHPDCVLDYRGCVTDPTTGQDFLPSMNRVLTGSGAWPVHGSAGSGVVSVHQGHQSEVALTGADSAEAVFAMSDRLFLPPGAPFSVLRGYGWYHETYRRVDGTWLLAKLRIQRLRVEAEDPAPHR